MNKFHYVHHACFILENENDAIIFDPFLDANPAGLQTADIKASHILVSHGHADHLGSAFDIAQKNAATIISTAEIANLAAEKGCVAHGLHIGGTHIFPFGKVRITPAFHGAGIAGGHACGFIVNFYGTTIYFAGDTGLFGDMKLLGELENIDYAILPIGDNYTMGPSDAVKAVELLNAKKVIPVHYNTWPVIAQDPEKFKKEVETKTSAKVMIVKPGSSIELS
ncbi:MAG: metal-dependent hydrolase [Acidaminococcaceae bacterium]